jgi:hypothetical protein
MRCNEPPRLWFSRRTRAENAVPHYVLEGYKSISYILNKFRVR